MHERPDPFAPFGDDERVPFSDGARSELEGTGLPPELIAAGERLLGAWGRLGPCLEAGYRFDSRENRADVRKIAHCAGALLEALRSCEGDRFALFLAAEDLCESDGKDFADPAVRGRMEKLETDLVVLQSRMRKHSEELELTAPRRGRPPEQCRWQLGARLADLFAQHGIEATKTVDGPFEQFFRVLLREAGAGEVRDVHELTAKAIDESRRDISDRRGRMIRRRRPP